MLLIYRPLMAAVLVRCFPFFPSTRSRATSPPADAIFRQQVRTFLKSCWTIFIWPVGCASHSDAGRFGYQIGASLHAYQPHSPTHRTRSTVSIFILATPTSLSASFALGCFRSHSDTSNHSWTSNTTMQTCCLLSSLCCC
ncbi:hypothetical protein EDB19DRAFT_1741851 [Suillus lakei]|nr:hypothetical protein EDB19DRAFT_1741851 [Suillus lakei]